MLKACSRSEVHMGKWLLFHSTHQMLPSNQISANKQIHTRKKYHNKLALVHGVKCYTRKWIQKYGNIEWEKGKGFGVGVWAGGQPWLWRALHPFGRERLSEKSLTLHLWIEQSSWWGLRTALFIPMNENMTWQSTWESWWQQLTWFKTININLRIIDSY